VGAKIIFRDDTRVAGTSYYVSQMQICPNRRLGAGVDMFSEVGSGLSQISIMNQLFKSTFNGVNQLVFVYYGIAEGLVHLNDPKFTVKLSD
jgi:hypothetical protein